jgi:hypothetical protein
MRFARNLLFIMSFSILIKPGTAQETKRFAGDYLAISGAVHVTIHLTQTGDSVTGTLDSPDFRIAGLPLSDIRISGQNLSFSAPTIKGAWTGFLSEDGNSLSGTWNQGNSVALNFTRIATPESHAATLSSSSPNPQSDSTCPLGSMADYWDGSSWKPMTMAAETGKKGDYSLTHGLKDPLNPMAGYGHVFMFEGTSAPTMLGPNPRFCFPVTVNSRGEYFIGILTVKRSDREVERFVSDRNKQPGGNLLFAANKSLATNVKPLSDHFVEVTPKEPLKEGQYVIANGMLMFDFGVK